VKHVVAVLALAGCGGAVASRVSTEPQVEPAGPPVSSRVATTDATLQVVPPSSAVFPTERVIPLDGDIAEIVFALDLGSHVVATDLSATYPPEADALPQIGYQRALSAEPILAFEPTLLIGTETAGPPEVIDELRRVGVPVEIVAAPDGASGPAAKIRSVAELLGVPERGAQLAAEVQADIDAATPTDPTAEPAAALRVAMLYVRGDNTQLVFGEGSGIDWLIELTGATDVADELGVVGHAELSAEALVVAAPDVLLVTGDGLASVGGVDGLLGLPAVAGTPAAATRSVLAYDAQLMLGNGPRTGEFLAQLRADLNDLATRLVEEPP
jgi:iron complex transport system substrate-binding protein